MLKVLHLQGWHAQLLASVEADIGLMQDPLPIHRQSVYLFGRERRVADIPTDHPSCSKQHSVLQFRCAFSADQSEHQLQRIAAPCQCLPKHPVSLRVLLERAMLHHTQLPPQ